MTTRAQRVAGRRQLCVPVDVGRVGIAVAAGARRAAAQEALALPQAHRVVREPARTTVGPVRGILSFPRSVFEHRLEKVVIVRAGRVPGGDDVAQGVALRADHAARLGIEARRPDNRALTGGAAGLRARVRLDVRAPGTMTPLTRCAEIHPLRRIGAGRRLVVVLLLADVAPDTVLVPLLDERLVVLVGPDDLHVVEPLLPLHVPARRQDDDPAVLDGRQVVLDAAAAEGVFDSMLSLLAGEVRLGDEVRTIGDAQPDTGVRFSVTTFFEKSDLTLAAVAGWSILLWRPPFQASCTCL